MGGLPIENSTSITTAVQILALAKDIFPHAPLLRYLPRPPRYQTQVIEADKAARATAPPSAAANKAQRHWGPAKSNDDVNDAISSLLGRNNDTGFSAPVGTGASQVRSAPVAPEAAKQQTTSPQLPKLSINRAYATEDERVAAEADVNETTRRVSELAFNFAWN